jgi:hypothetical protein
MGTSTGRTLGVNTSNADLDGGVITNVAIDNSPIGATTPAAITGTNIAATGNLTVTGTVSGGLKGPVSAVVAAGGNVGTANAVVAGLNVVTGADGTKGVVLPVAVAGTTVKIANNGGSNLKVYPQIGSTVNQAAANTALVMAANTAVDSIAFNTTAWFTIPVVPS